MVEALRRLLWLVPLLALGAFALFVALSQSPRVRAQQGLPVFYNPRPSSARAEMEGALHRLLAGEPGAEDRLAELGGAALPHLLPRLATLSVRDRRRISAALVPLRHRLEGIHQDSLWEEGDARRERSADAELIYWERFYQDHDLDFRPVTVARLTRRLAERPLSLREGDLYVLDTYALPNLIALLGRVTTAEDLARLHRLTPAIARASRKPYRLAVGASVAEGQRLATQIRRDWDRIGPQWTQLDRFETLAARLSQTEFAVWLFQTGRAITRLDSPILAERVSSQSRFSLILLLAGALGALICAPTAATVLQLAVLRAGARKRGTVEARTALAIGLGLLLPGAVLHAPGDRAACAGLTLLVSGVSATALLHRELSDRLDWRTHQVLLTRGPRDRVSAMVRWLAPSIPTFAPIFVAELLAWITCIELSSGQASLGTATVHAYLRGDIDFLMAVCLGLGVLTAAVQLFADTALGSARWQRGES